MGRYAPSLVMAILVGVLALFGELAGFYAIAWRLHLAITPLWVVFAWGVVAVIAGPILATGGYVSRTKGGFTRLLGMSTLGATFIGEGLFLLLAIDPAPKKIMALWLAIAAIITVDTHLARAQADTGMGDDSLPGSCLSDGIRDTHPHRNHSPRPHPMARARILKRLAYVLERGRTPEERVEQLRHLCKTDPQVRRPAPDEGGIPEAMLAGGWICCGLPVREG